VRNMVASKYLWLAGASLISFVVIWGTANPLYAIAAYTVFGVIFLLLTTPIRRRMVSRLDADIELYSLWWWGDRPELSIPDFGWHRECTNSQLSTAFG
jgi:hypothetical protein